MATIEQYRDWYRSIEVDINNIRNPVVRQYQPFDRLRQEIHIELFDRALRERDLTARSEAIMKAYNGIKQDLAFYIGLDPDVIPPQSLVSEATNRGLRALEDALR